MKIVKRSEVNRSEKGRKDQGSKDNSVDSAMVDICDYTFIKMCNAPPKMT